MTTNVPARGSSRAQHQDAFVFDFNAKIHGEIAQQTHSVGIVPV